MTTDFEPADEPNAKPNANPAPDPMDTAPESQPSPEPEVAKPSVRRYALLVLAFILGSVVLLTLAAGGVDAIGHAAAHALPNFFPGGCGSP